MEELKAAYKIYFFYKGNPKTHQEWAERFNLVEKIRKILTNRKTD